MELKIRSNKDGEYVAIDANNFSEGIDFALKNKLSQIHLRGPIGTDSIQLDFSLFNSVSELIEVISVGGIFNKQLNIINTEGLYSLKRLRKLIITDKPNFTIDPSNFSSLSELSFPNSSKIVGLNTCDHLKTLVITQDFDEDDLQSISDLNRLEKLHIYKSKKIKSLAGLEHLKRCTELVLAFNNSLEDISAINDSMIKKLRIEKCKKLSNFQILASNKLIEDLFITEVESLHFISSMNKLRKLHIWKSDEGDMTPILNHPNLQQAYITKNQKHYSHKQSEITKHLENR